MIMMIPQKQTTNTVRPNIIISRKSSVMYGIPRSRGDDTPDNFKLKPPQTSRAYWN